MNQHCSHDFVYFDARNWTDDEENEARALQRDLDILTNIQEFRGRVSEYPSASSVQRRIPANYACPCGSGRKYKRCCGKNE
ncbi:MAG: hypothetical protein EOP04_15020 [Proteobacteria bacterium]|nr:MAG: hypothetical protein EOP04_15020 [Pseudomonadota bacterium]